MKVLPKYEGLEIVQRTYKAGAVEYHRYEVDGFDCGGHCADCRATKKRPCKGLPSVTTFTGAYGGIGGAYVGGMNYILDTIFGNWKDKVAKNETEMFAGWLFDGSGTPEMIGPTDEPQEDWHPQISRPTSKQLFDSGMQNLGAYLRKEVEAFPTPGDISRDYGTGVHAALESLLAGDGEVPSQYADSVRDIVAWLNKGGKDGPYIVEDSEVSVFHPELRYAGQIDCVARCGDRVIIIDWKSGKEIYPSHAMQVAAYAMAYSEMTGLAVSEAYVVKASPITGFEAKQVADLALAQKAFIAMQETKRNADRIKWREDK